MMAEPKAMEVVEQPASESDIENNHLQVTDVVGTHQVSGYY
jgi:hypothetical protein